MGSALAGWSSQAEHVFSTKAFKCDFGHQTAAICELWNGKWPSLETQLFAFGLSACHPGLTYVLNSCFFSGSMGCLPPNSKVSLQLVWSLLVCNHFHVVSPSFWNWAGSQTHQWSCPRNRYRLKWCFFKSPSEETLTVWASFWEAIHSFYLNWNIHLESLVFSNSFSCFSNSWSLVLPPNQVSIFQLWDRSFSCN